MATTTLTATPSPSQSRIPTSVFIALTAGVLSGSMAAILTRYALLAGAPPLAIAFTRLALAALVITPIAIGRHWREFLELGRRDLLIAGFAGIWMAVHFVLWISSLQSVGILIATVLVTSSPIWTALLEVTFLKARLTRMVIYGVLAVIIGNILIAFAGDHGGSAGSNPLLGATLAVSAAIAIAIQRTLSRGVRQRVRLMPYLWLMYTCAALTLLVVLILTGTPVTGYSGDAYFWMVMLTIFPQLIGHSSFTYALRYMPATYISLAIQVEPVIATAAAFVLFHELPVPLQVVGSAIIVAGVIMAIKRGSSPPTSSGSARPQ